ncbi:peptide chain release factor N(5)-glutamine methyltransferase [Alphaproteobacteria bacterium KMM 3653]|uniref:Release factor glutamine methyltransferase n=1 Tax=Harenicola maris TaxID=2841044 RepID=A0AAP2G2X6_9RHOB|nr:peptide chain release factor N(5)-glutamine methyltransferase [Harenicola maris]
MTLTAAQLTSREATGIDAREAGMLLAHAAGKSLHAIDPVDLTPQVLERFRAMVAERAAHRPIAQLLGRRAFWKHDFAVTGDTLDPRPDTETLVEAALARPFSRLLDLGTGTGCIAISLLAEAPQASGLATDVSAAALAVAGANADAIGIGPRLSFAQSDWWAGVTGRFDLIVSNPPYIAADEMAGLAPDVRDWEPHLALTDGADGLTAYRILAAGLADHLAPGGRALFEIGPAQGADVTEILAQAGWPGAQVLPDIDGRPRVVSVE